MENIFTTSYFHNLIVYTVFILYGLLNIYVSKKFAETEKDSLFQGLIISMLFPLVLIIFYVPFQGLRAFNEFPEMMTILIIANGLTFLHARKKYKLKQEVLKYTVDLYNSKEIVKKVLAEKLLMEKEIIENGGMSKYYYDLDSIDKAIETMLGMTDYFEKVKNI